MTLRCQRLGKEHQHSMASQISSSGTSERRHCSVYDGKGTLFFVARVTTSSGRHSKNDPLLLVAGLWLADDGRCRVSPRRPSIIVATPYYCCSFFDVEF